MDESLIKEVKSLLESVRSLEQTIKETIIPEQQKHNICLFGEHGRDGLSMDNEENKRSIKAGEKAIARLTGAYITFVIMLLLAVVRGIIGV